MRWSLTLTLLLMTVAFLPVPASAGTAEDEQQECALAETSCAFAKSTAAVSCAAEPGGATVCTGIPTFAWHVWSGAGTPGQGSWFYAAQLTVCAEILCVSLIADSDVYGCQWELGDDTGCAGNDTTWSVSAPGFHVQPGDCLDVTFEAETFVSADIPVSSALPTGAAVVARATDELTHCP